MSLGYDIAQALPGLRAEAESRMDDQVKVTRWGEKAWDEDAGDWVAATVIVYEGKARIKGSTSMAIDADAGSQLVTVGRLQVHVPIGSPAFTANDLVSVVESPSNPAQVGRVLTVVGPVNGSQVTALRYQVEASDGR